jgi:hypothetical protein
MSIEWEEVEPGFLEGKYWLHNDSFHEYAMDLIPEKYYSQELLNKIGQPFYEVTLRVRLELATGEVTILSATARD